MPRWIFVALFWLPLPVLAAPVPFNADQQERLRCVAALAIIANDQQRGSGTWEAYPPLAVRGARFSDSVLAAVMKESRRSRDDVRAEILAQLATLQKDAANAPDAAANIRAVADPCIVLLDRLVPPPQPPTLPQCAAALSLAYEDEKTHRGMTKTARNLAIFGAVLESHARDEMKAAGKTEAESDTILGLEKERLLAEFKAHKGKGVQDKVDFQSCFVMAQP